MMNIKELRKKAGISQSKLSELTGISQTNISCFETGRRNPNAYQKLRLEVAFGVDSDTYSDSFSCRICGAEINIDNEIDEFDIDELNYRYANCGEGSLSTKEILAIHGKLCADCFYKSGG